MQQNCCEQTNRTEPARIPWEAYVPPVEKINATFKFYWKEIEMKWKWNWNEINTDAGAAAGAPAAASAAAIA